MLYNLIRSKINHAARFLSCLCVSLLICQCYGMSFNQNVIKDHDKTYIMTVSRVYHMNDTDHITPINECEASLVYACASLVVGQGTQKTTSLLDKSLGFSKTNINNEYISLNMKNIDPIFYRYRDIRNIYAKSLPLNQTDYKLIFDNFSTRLNNLYDHEYIKKTEHAVKIIAFNEMFFSKIITPDYYASTMSNLMYNFFDNKTYVYLNFLYSSMYDIENTRLDRADQYAQYIRTSYVCCNINPSYEDFIKNTHINAINAINNTDYKLRIFNRSGFFYNAIRLSYYDKVSYFAEGENFMIYPWGKYSLYNHGDGEDHESIWVKDSQNSKIKDALQFVMNNITTETCFDLAQGIRRMNNWNNRHYFDNIAGYNNPLIHIIASNCIDSFQNCDNFLNLPRDKLITHVDPKVFNGGVFGINNRSLELRNELYNREVYCNNLSSTLAIVNSPMLSISLNVNSKVFVFCLYDLDDSINRLNKGY